MMRLFAVSLLSCFFLIFPAKGEELRFPAFFTDHMVLQREAPIPIWGWAGAGENVTVALGEVSSETTADPSGRWRVSLPAQKANAEGLVLKASTPNKTISVGDVLIGEVWLCSGQSNMEWSVRQSEDPANEIARANHPLIRQVKILRQTSATPQEDVTGYWVVCSPDTVGNFTAAGYFMARELQEKLQVPIGLLNISWGGTRIEPWTPIEGFAAVPELKHTHRQIEQSLPDSDAFRSVLENHISELKQWSVAAEAALKERKGVEPSPSFPKELTPLTTPSSPTAIFNAMMAPVVGYGMRGAIWYQGESNHNDGMGYFDKKKALLSGWRELWGIGDFPFYFVQIAPFQYGQEDSSILAEFWEAQEACLDLPNTGMVVTSDIGNISDIHPKNKQEVGRRLALLARKHTYDETELVASGPVFESLKVDGNTLRVKFGSVAGGLQSSDGKPLSHFEILGKSRKFLPASARIEGGDSVVLQSAEIEKPTAMRFAWHKLAEPNLVNGAGLPAAAFRAGEVPKLDTLADNIAESNDYELVYDLDLKELGPQVRYQQDLSSELAGELERVAYYIELVQGDGSLQWTWVTMDPFTSDVTKLGVPYHGSEIHWQKAVSNLSVRSSFPEHAAEGVSGNIEFWPTNYGATNSANVEGASSGRWDTGDRPEGTGAGYGSMQVHNTKAKRTVFAVNHWGAGDAADIGIGNSVGKTDDWTFAANAGSLQDGRLRVFVKLKP